ncbi:uncharacterized protein [Pyrus communis]|uniref:uncharacterized protein n=1 Tax=Pyrus communis TaxID=23211 RepID=UPI0035C0C510
MASSSRPSGASVPSGLDVAWKYARPIEGNKHGTICTFCESTFQSGGITRLKYHLAGFDPHKSVKKCKEVPPDIKNESNGKTIFLKSVDASNKTKDAKYITKLLKDVIKEVGSSNVVHIVTNNGSAFVKAGEIMMKWYPIYWTPCAAYCIDIIFEDVGEQESVANVINKARKLTNYIYNHGWLLAQMRIFCQGDLVRPGAIRFATNYITINSILKKKVGLRQLFTSEEWYNSRFSESEEGKRIESRVLDHRFWDAME